LTCCQRCRRRRRSGMACPSEDGEFAVKVGGKPVERAAMKDSSGETVVLARLATDAATAQALTDALAEALDAGEAAVAAHGGAGDAGGAGGAGDWSVEIYFARAPDEDAVRALVGRIAGEEARARLTFATIARADRVAASLEGLPPVEAGRLV